MYRQKLICKTCAPIQIRNWYNTNMFKWNHWLIPIFIHEAKMTWKLNKLSVNCVGFSKRRIDVERRDPKERAPLLNDNQHNTKESTSEGIINLNIIIIYGIFRVSITYYKMNNIVSQLVKMYNHHKNTRHYWIT